MAEQRQRVVTELINTEKHYCNDLELCVKHFLLELQTAQVGVCRWGPVLRRGEGGGERWWNKLKESHLLHAMLPITKKMDHIQYSSKVSLDAHVSRLDSSHSKILSIKFRV